MQDTSASLSPMSTPPPMPPSGGTCRPNDANNPDSISNEMRNTLKALLTSMDGLSTTGVRRSRAGIAARATACHYQLSQPQPQSQQQPDTTNESDSNIQKPADNIFDRVASMVGRSLQDEVRASSPNFEYEEVLNDQKYSLRISMPVNVVMQSTLQEEAAATTRATTTTRSPRRPRRGRRPRPSNDSSGILTSTLHHREGPPIRGVRSANLEDELVGAKTNNEDDDNNNNNDDDGDDENDIKVKDGAGDAGDDCSLTCALSNESSTLNSSISNNGGGDDSRSRLHSSLDTDTTEGNGHQQNPPIFEADSCICERDGWYTLSTIIDEEIAKKEKGRKWYR